jgi:dTDP-4-amino-4,6-dideoxygalactose transaminase
MKANQSPIVRQVPLIKADLPDLAALEVALAEVLTSGKVTNFGKHVELFEQKTAAYFGVDTATVSSGTMGLVFALQALGLQHGQRVVLPSFTFVATAQAVCYAGGVPLFVEIRDDLTLDAQDLEGVLDRHKEVSVVVGVHTFGLPCQCNELDHVIQSAARKRDRPISVLYDAAHAFGSSTNGRKVGTFGDAEVFSLSVTKALVSIEGGLVASRDSALIGRVKKMRNYGIEDNYNAHYPGMNGKMSELHALVGLYNLERLDGYLLSRREHASYYINRIRAATSFEVLSPAEGIVHTFKDFTVLTPAALDGRRSEVISRLKERGVETRAYFYPPVHEQKFFARFADRQLPLTERLSRRVLTLPFYTSITREEMDYVVDSLADIEASLT